MHDPAGAERQAGVHQGLLIIAFRCLGRRLASASLGEPAPDKAAALPSRATYQVDAAKSRLVAETETTSLSAMFVHDHKVGVRDFTAQATAPSPWWTRTVA